MTVFGPTWGRRSRRGWRQGSRGWGQQEFEEGLKKGSKGWAGEEQGSGEEEELEEKGIQRWLSSGELLGVGQVSVLQILIQSLALRIKFDQRGISANLSEP